jgi:hypothetical protein
MNNFTLCHGAILDRIGGPDSALFSRGAGDRGLIAITVYGAPELTRSIRVSAEGFIRLPMLKQKIEARGLMPAEGAALVALERGGAGLAVIDGCAIASGRRASGVRSFADALDEAIGRLGFGGPSRSRQMIESSSLRGAARVVGGRPLGGCAVRTPLSSTSALGKHSRRRRRSPGRCAPPVVAEQNRRVLVISAGTDGDVGVVAMSRPIRVPHDRGHHRRRRGLGVRRRQPRGYSSAGSPGRSAVGRSGRSACRRSRRVAGGRS